MANKLKRNYIQLVEGEKDNGEPILETYLTPHFITADLWYECIDVMDELEQMEEKQKAAEGEEKQSMASMMKKQMDMLMDTTVKIYGKQFTKKDLRSKLHAPNMIEDLQEQIQFIAMGQQDEATKKFVESKS
ncbi:phage tail assembly chaperone G [Salinicoccus sp. HZC-1]|uniref:phage tail assembly chaperone G n=1 Tax=Salinicoccus sp. HZC-1 TaxID=3385497 RepID=UPI00398A95B8